MSATSEKPFRVHGIELVAFAIQPQPADARAETTFEFNVQQEHTTNVEKRLIIFFTTITIREPGKEALLARLQVASGFEIPLFEQVIKKEGEGYSIPHELSASMSSIAAATARGVLYSQLRGSYLQHSILPLLPVEE